MKKLKKIDLFILNEMVKNASVQVKELAEKFNVTEKTIRNRINGMEEDEVFKKNIVVNPEFFNHNSRFDVFIRVIRNVEEVKKLIIEKYQFNILYIGSHWGDDDISIQLIFPKPNMINSFKEEMVSLDEVKQVTITMVPLVYKDTYDWIPNPRQLGYEMSDEEFSEFKSNLFEI